MLMNDPLMVTNDPLIRLQRRQQIWLAIFTLLLGTFLLADIASLFRPVFSISLNDVSNIISICGLFIVAILAFLSGRKTIKQRIQQYQKLGTGNSDLLAQEQPSPNEHALPCPTTITLYPKTGTMRAIYGFLALVTLILAGLTVWGLVAFFTSPYNAYYSSGVNDPIFAAIAGGFALLFGTLLWFIWWYSHNWVKVTEIGLETRLNGRKMQIAWENANFFSVDGKINSEKPLIYILSGKRGGVIWIQLVSLSQASSPRPALPFDQYLQQSKALLAVVAGRTGLPLYDMRRPAD